MPGQTGSINPLLALLPPDQQQNLLQLGQQQAIGQALLQQGLQPMDTGSNPVGGMAYHVSPLNGVSKLLNAYIGNKLSMNALGQQANLYGQIYGGAFGGGQQPQQQSQAPTTDAGGMTGDQSGAGVVSSPVATPGAAPSGAQLGAAMGGAAPAQAMPQQSMPNGALTLPGKTPQQSMLIFSMLGPDAYGRMLEAQTAPTAATLAARQGGFDPAAANQAQFQKDSYVAPTTGTGIMRNPFTQQPVAFNPAVPEGSQPLFDASGNVAQVQAIPGAQAAMQGNAAATTAGEGSALPYDKAVDAQGNPLPIMSRTQAATGGAGVPLPLRNNNPGAVSPNGQVAQYPTMQAGLQAMDSNLASYAKDPNVKTVSDAITKWVGSPPNAPAYISDVTARLGVKPNTPIDLTNPAQRQALSTAIMLHENGPSAVFATAGQQPAQAQGNGAIYAAAPMGAQAAATSNATNQQSELSKKWSDLSAANQQAQSTVSYLQNIKTLAGKAAVGPQSDRLNYANGLLSLVGNEQATDAVTANNLLDKYSNQITARLSANGMGTDSARAILQSAYPNSHMTAAAINEAADNLIGAQQMTQAKTRILAPIRNAGDPVAYTNTETKFDQAADPRIWQLQSMAPADQAKYVAGLSPQAAKMLLQNRAVLRGMGAFQ